jgi:CubicO group peptidase (beta-lactamase class C family)
MRFHIATIFTVLAFSHLSFAQQQLPQQLDIEPPSDVPIAIQILRWHMLDNNISPLIFQNMESIFTIRTVARSGPVWRLPYTEYDLNFSYGWKGQIRSADEIMERTYTNALLIMKDGRIVSEIYRNNSDENTRFIAWSMTKSLTSILIGCALAEKRIESLDTPITDYISELKTGAYDGVSIRHIMQMRSGVEYEERYDFSNPGVAAKNHIVALVRNTARFADVATSLPQIHEPGDVFQYKTIDTAVLGWLIERVTKSSVAAYTAQCLWEPLGAESDGYYIMDGSPGTGREFSGAGYNATLRDYARVGQMMLDGGIANGQRIVSEDWVRQSTRPVGKEDNHRGGYGLQWWTIGASNAYTALGLQGQYIYIDPDTRTVIVKLSYFPPGDNSDVDSETLAFMAAASAWQPQ